MFHHIVFLAPNILKLWLFISGQITGYKGFKGGKFRRKLPVYSILIPMYKEAGGVEAIVDHMKKLEYPPHLLDIKLVVEEDDVDTLAAVYAIDLPPSFQVIEVPYSHPRTKPKALNYSMHYVKGRFVTIYDVEDRPELDQILKAVYAFASLPKDVICLQAKLAFSNSSNLLVRFFGLEYRIWFDFLLPPIDNHNLPIPLGGNSNHFKVAPLKTLGLWDAYNVTEDADLGLRIYTRGFRTCMIDSYTFEEAPTDLWNWINQRSRWIKGFVQTYLVYLHQKKARPIPFVHIFIGLATYSFFALPIYLIIAWNGEGLDALLSKANAYMTMLYMYSSCALAMFIGSKQPKFLDWIATIFWPFYFILHVIASYKALFELLTKPFYWNKTEH